MMRQKQIIRRITAFFLAVTLVMGFSYPIETTVKAASNNVTIFPAENTTPSEDCIFLGIPGSYLTDAQAVIDEINKIRLEACKEGVISPATNKALTIEDYVPIKWSAGVEQQMRFRASEAGTAKNCLGSGHTRLNGGGIWAMDYPTGFHKSSEIIAYNWSTNVTDSVGQWYEEKEAWVNQTSGAVTGHYTAMINPDNTYIGLATFYSSSVYWKNTTVAQLGSGTNLDETPMEAVDNCVQTVEVKNSYITSLSLEDVVLTSGESAVLSLNAMVNGLTKEVEVLSDVEYTSSDDTVAEVDNQGSLTAKGVGTAVITAKAGTKLTTCTITVEEASSASTDETATTEKATESTDEAATTEKATESTDETTTTEKATESTDEATTTEKATESTDETAAAEKPSASTDEATTTTEKATESTDETAAAEKPSASTEKATTENRSTGTSEIVTTKQDASTTQVHKGEKITAKDGTIYRVADNNQKNKAVEYQGKPNAAKSKVTIPSSITIQGIKYKVTGIADNAFKNNKKIKSVTIGKNINKIGKNAFQNCKNLKKITIKSTKLKQSALGKQAFSGIPKKAVVYVPASKRNAYKKILKRKGLPSSVKIKTI